MKLLLADDEKELSQAICAILEHKGYEVDPVYDGREALEKARIQYYDGYIFDIMMPEMDGVEVLSALRQQGNTTPALLLTAKAEVEDRVKGLNAGADDYLTKPFAMKELIARIGAMTRRKEMMADDRLVCGNVALMRRTMELTNGDSSIRLSQHEYGLAELFFQNPGKNITTPQIDLLVPDSGKLLVRNRVHGQAVQLVMAAGGTVQGADDVHQRGFPRPRGPDDGHEFPGCHLQVDAVEDFQLIGSPDIVFFDDVLHRDGVFAQRITPFLRQRMSGRPPW